MSKEVEEQIKEEIVDKQPQWNNLPEDLESAIERIKELERGLEDLDRSVEIAIAMRQLYLIEGFSDTAKGLLKNKITPIHNDGSPIKILLLTDVDKETKDAETT
jgi:hypothetical protein